MKSMERYRYLVLPRDYCDWLGGLRWSADEDAIVYRAGRIFAFPEEIALLLEGYAATRKPLHFGHMLHLLDLLCCSPRGDRTYAAKIQEVVQSIRQPGTSVRNAGAFAAVLCPEVPPIPYAVDVANLCQRLRSTTAPIRWFVGQYNNVLAKGDVVLRNR